MTATEAVRIERVGHAVVLVPLDGSLHSLDALPVARALAAIKHGVVHVIHIGDERALPPPEIMQKLGLAEADLRGSVVNQRSGDPGEEICRAARGFPDATIVMCTHAGSPSIAGVLGRVAARVLRDAACPVVFVRPDRGIGAWALRNALVAHDGTPSTTACICPAAALATEAGARLSVLHVAKRDAPKPNEPGTLTTPRYVDQQQHEWPAWASEFTDRLMSTCPIDPSMLRLSLAAGDPGDAVLRYARENDVDIIIVAWRGSLEESRAAVVKAVLGAAPCPVMVLRVPSA